MRLLEVEWLSDCLMMSFVDLEAAQSHRDFIFPVDGDVRRRLFMTSHSASDSVAIPELDSPPTVDIGRR